MLLMLQAAVLADALGFSRAQWISDDNAGTLRADRLVGFSLALQPHNSLILREKADVYSAKRQSTVGQRGRNSIYVQEFLSFAGALSRPEHDPR
jgi:hypothetical protein